MKSHLQTQKEANIDVAMEQGMDAAEEGLGLEANIYDNFVPELHLHQAWITGHNYQTSLIHQRKNRINSYIDKAVAQGVEAAKKGLLPEENLYDTDAPELYLHQAWLTGYNSQKTLMEQQKALSEYLKKNGLE